MDAYAAEDVAAGEGNGDFGRGAVVVRLVADEAVRVLFGFGGWC